MSTPQETKRKPGKPSLADIISMAKKPKRAVITAGMPYANGPLHLGHFAGAQVPADIFARFMKMLIGEENVLFVCGTDDHGSTSEVAALKQGKDIRDFIDEIHQLQRNTLKAYNIDLDIYTGTSVPETFAFHQETCHEFLESLSKNEMIYKKESKQWFDPEIERFLPDRYVSGTCPKCGHKGAYANECGACGAEYESDQLLDPISAVSSSKPVLKDTWHLWLDMWKVSGVLLKWVQSKKKAWRKSVYNEVIQTLLPCLSFSSALEENVKSFKEELPKVKTRFAPGKKMIAQFESLEDLEAGRKSFEKHGVACELVDGWAHRSITRDTKWGISIPESVASGFEEKTLYVWPDSLIAPISFTKLALSKKGLDPSIYKDFWHDSEAGVYQFLGQDNVFFYTLMQGALWIGSQENVKRLPVDGERVLTDIFSSYHLQVNGEKMSKSTGNFVTGDELIEKHGAHPDQVRYYLSLLSLAEKQSNFDFVHFEERNKFLAGPLNAAIEKPISAAIKKFDSTVPSGTMNPKVEKETFKVVSKYLKGMQKSEFSTLLFDIENYARLINSMFTQYKPHDDRFPEQERKDALYSSFVVLKNIMIMLYPFAPVTMDKLRVSLNLEKAIFAIEELAKPMSAGHKIGNLDTYFPSFQREEG